MADHGKVDAYTVSQAAADLTATQYHILRYASATTTNIASNAAAAFAVGAIGVQQNKPNSGQSVQVGYMGETKLVGGAQLTAGRLLASNGSGRAAHAASGDLCIGRALEACGADGEVFRAMIFPPFRLSGTN